jgi:hypothetical protein
VNKNLFHPFSFLFFGFFQRAGWKAGVTEFVPDRRHTANPLIFLSVTPLFTPPTVA